MYLVLEADERTGTSRMVVSTCPSRVRSRIPARSTLRSLSSIPSRTSLHSLLMNTGSTCFTVSLGKVTISRRSRFLPVRTIFQIEMKEADRVTPNQSVRLLMRVLLTMRPTPVSRSSIKASSRTSLLSCCTTPTSSGRSTRITCGSPLLALISMALTSARISRSRRSTTSLVLRSATSSYRPMTPLVVFTLRPTLLSHLLLVCCPTITNWAVVLIYRHRAWYRPWYCHVRGNIPGHDRRT